MDFVAEMEAVERLQNFVGEPGLKKMVSEAVASKRFQEYISNKANKKILERCVAGHNNSGRKIFKNLPAPVTALSGPALAQEIRRVRANCCRHRFFLSRCIIISLSIILICYESVCLIWD